MHELSVKIRPRIDSISTLSRLVRRFFHHHKLENGGKFDLALEELVANIIRYGKPENPDDLEIYLKIKRQDTVIEAHLVDNGVPFNPLTQEGPNLRASVQERSIGGLGVHLAKVNLDDLYYERKKNQNHLYARLVVSSSLRRSHLLS